MKYLMIVAVVGALFLFGFATLSTNILKNTASSEVERRAVAVEQLLTLVLQPALDLNQPEKINSVASMIMEIGELSCLHILHEKGEVLAEFGEHSPSQAHPRSLFSISDSAQVDKELVVSTQNSDNFHIHYGIEAQSLLASIKKASQQLYWLVGLEVLLIVIATYFSLKVFSKQHAHLRVASHHVSEGNFSYRIPEGACDYLVETAAAFNLMTSRLEHYEAIQAEEIMRLKELSQAVEQSPVAVVMTNNEGLITYANPCFYEVSGYQESEVIGKNPRLLQSGFTTEEEYIGLWKTISSGGTWRGELQNKRKDGALYWDKTIISPVNSDSGEVTHYISVKEDVTEYKKIEERMRVATTVFDAASEAIMVTDLNGSITMVNPAFSEITGFEPKEIIGKNPRLLNSGHHDDSFYKKMFETLKRDSRWEGEVWNRRKTGEVYPQWQTVAMVRDEAGEPLEFIALFSDITKRKQKEDEIRYRANYDALTGLPNRSLFNERLAQGMKLSKRESSGLAFLYLDLDGFKQVNDSYGHLIGDQVLKEVAHKLLSCIRESDSVGRLGGDEFAIFLNSSGSVSASVSVAEKIIKSLSPPMELNGEAVFIGASIGISLFPGDGTSIEQLYERADIAMYEAKKRGKNQYCFYNGFEAT